MPAWLVWAIVAVALALGELATPGLFFLGPVAISSSNKARQAMASDPSLGGGGLAIAGLVLGILDLVGFALQMIYRASLMR